MNFPPSTPLLEAFGPELLQRYGLAPDSITQDQYDALRQAVSSFKINKQGGLIRQLLTLLSREPQQQAVLLTAVEELAQLRQYGFDAGDTILQATSVDALVQAARARGEKFGKKAATKSAEEFSVNDSEPDWTDGRYRVFIAHGENDCIRYGQNQRYGFCISRRQNNYYHDYRAKHNASYYFVYDTQLSPYDKKHITVIAARQDGSYEFTYANNSQDYDTRKLNANLDTYLATKPGLEKARAMFVSKPLTDGETSQVAAARQVLAAQGVGYEQLTPEQQQTYVRLGGILSDDNYTLSDVATRDTYIARAHMLTNSQASLSTEAQRKRAAQLFWRYNEVDKKNPASWLHQYPLVEPAAGGAKPVAWPPQASAVPTWFGAQKTGSSPLFECACEDQRVSTPAGDLSWQKLQSVATDKPVHAFPVDELTVLDAADEREPLVARLAEGLVAITGGAHLLAARGNGELYVCGRHLTREDIAYAQQASTRTLLEHRLSVAGHRVTQVANQLLSETNMLVPAVLLAQAGASETREYFRRILREGVQLSPEQLPPALRETYFQQASKQGYRLPLAQQLARMEAIARH